MRYKNNPANIRYVAINKWKGMIEPSNGFCQFEHIDYGLRALIVLLRGYIKRGFNTPEKIINRFCPSNDKTGKNDTSLYIRYICDYLRITCDTPINYNSNLFHFLCVKICQVETNTVIGAYNILLIIKKFKL